MTVHKEAVKLKEINQYTILKEGFENHSGQHQIMGKTDTRGRGIPKLISLHLAIKTIATLEKWTQFDKGTHHTTQRTRKREGINNNSPCSDKMTVSWQSIMGQGCAGKTQATKGKKISTPWVTVMIRKIEGTDVPPFEVKNAGEIALNPTHSGPSEWVKA